MAAQKKNKAGKGTLKKILRYVKKQSGWMVLSLIMAALCVAGTLYLPVLAGKAIDCIIGPGNVDFQGIYGIAHIMIAVLLLNAVCQWIMNVANNHVTYEVVRNLREDAFKKIEILPLSYLDKHPSGEIVSRVITDADQFADGLLMGFTQLFTGVITILGTLGFMLSVNLNITLVVVLVTPVSLFVASFIARRTYSMFTLQSKTRGEQTTLIDEAVGNQKLVQAFGQQQSMLDKFDEINERLQKCSLQAVFFSSLTNPCTRFVNSLVYTGVALCGGFLVIGGGLSVGQLSCMLSYANQYTKPFNEISGVVTELQNALACAARLIELIEEEPQVPDAQDAVVLDEAKGRVELEDVSFSYVPEKPLIEHLNLSVQPGQRVALVGPTGCGKTTLINLLLRFYDVNEGSIRVDGKDIRDYTRKSLRSNFGMVLQDTWLKNGTIRENICMGKPDATEEEMTGALYDAAAEFVMELPDGLDTICGESGTGLSEGQAQRIAIARGLLRPGGIMLLDEPTSALDSNTEHTLLERLSRCSGTKTIIIITHKEAASGFCTGTLRIKN